MITFHRRNSISALRAFNSHNKIVDQYNKFNAGISNDGPKIKRQIQKEIYR